MRFRPWVHLPAVAAAAVAAATAAGGRTLVAARHVVTADRGCLRGFSLATPPLGAQVLPTTAACSGASRGVEVGAHRGESRGPRQPAHTRRTTTDAWLTALFTHRHLDAWALAARRVAWIDTNLRRRASDGGVLVGTRVCAATRGSVAPRPLTQLEWGATSNTGAYRPALDGLVFDGQQAAWHDARSRLAGQGPPARGRDAGIFSCGVGGGPPRRVGSSSEPDGGVLAVSGTRVFYVEPRGPGAAGQALAWWDAASGRRSSMPVARPIDGLSAGAGAIVWKERAPDAQEQSPDSVYASDPGLHHVVKLSGSAAGEASPAVSGDLAVWSESRPGGAGAVELIGGRLAPEQRQFIITLAAAPGEAPDLLIVSGTWLVWAIRQNRPNCTPPGWSAAQVACGWSRRVVCEPSEPVQHVRQPLLHCGLNLCQGRLAEKPDLCHRVSRGHHAATVPGGHNGHRQHHRGRRKWVELEHLHGGDGHDNLQQNIVGGQTVADLVALDLGDDLEPLLLQELPEPRQRGPRGQGE